MSLHERSHIYSEGADQTPGPLQVSSISSNGLQAAEGLGASVRHVRRTPTSHLLNVGWSHRIRHAASPRRGRGPGEAIQQARHRGLFIRAISRQFGISNTLQLRAHPRSAPESDAVHHSLVIRWRPKRIFFLTTRADIFTGHRR